MWIRLFHNNSGKIWSSHFRYNTLPQITKPHQSIHVRAHVRHWGICEKNHAINTIVLVELSSHSLQCEMRQWVTHEVTHPLCLFCLQQVWEFKSYTFWYNAPCLGLFSIYSQFGPLPTHIPLSMSIYYSLDCNVYQ